MAKKKPAPKKKPRRPSAPPSKPPVKPPAPPATPPPPPDRDPGQRHRDEEAARRRNLSASVREVGPLPTVVDPARRQRGRESLLAFCREYFPRRFRLPFSANHFAAIDRMQRCTDEGGRFALAMPRGDGKTTVAECAVLRSVLYGFRRFVLLVCATAKLATRRLKSILRELETNDALAADFPEVCYLIRSLERIHARAKGQTLNGKATRIEFTADSLILPTVPGSAASGAIVQVAGTEGAIRGLNIAGPEGEPLRPDMAVIDDAQTRESAKSPLQTADREAVITDDVMGLAGPDVSMAAVMLCTVIYPNDLSDRFLSGDRHPEWSGLRTRMLEAFPERMDLWDEYAEVLRDSLRTGDGGRRATEFYAERRDEMDRGAKVSWPERKKPGELSGLQSAMNLYVLNPRGFKAEYQNDPDPEGGSGTAKELLPANVAGRLSGVERLAVPPGAGRLTAMIDAGGHLLWYGVVAWDERFGGSVLDYGTWPRQARSVFAAADPRPGLSDVYPGLGEKERVYAGLRDLSNEICGRVYYRAGSGEELRVDRCLVDSGWLPDVVEQFCRQSPHAAVLLPSLGMARATTRLAISEWKQRRAHEKIGYHWAIGLTESGRSRVVKFDPDAWKSELYARLTTPPGGNGYLAFHGTSAGAHELIGEHCAAESAEPATLRGVTFDKWVIRPHRPDNHLLDVLVGACVGASTLGIVYDSGAAAGDPARPRPTRKKVNIEDLYRKARGIAPDAPLTTETR